MIFHFLSCQCPNQPAEEGKIRGHTQYLSLQPNIKRRLIFLPLPGQMRQRRRTLWGLYGTRNIIQRLKGHDPRGDTSPRPFTMERAQWRHLKSLDIPRRPVIQNHKPEDMISGILDIEDMARR